MSIVVKAEPEEVRRAVDAVYRDLARRVAIPGFRKGKAPRSLLEQRLSPQEAERTALDDLAPAAVDEGIRQAGVESFGEPDFERADVEADGSATFVATVTPKPEVELGEYRGLTAVRPVVETTEEQVEAELHKTRERYARYDAVEDRAAQDGDLALVDYELVIDDQVVEGQSTSGYPCEIGSDRLFPELNEKLVGLRSGEQVRIPASFPAEHRDPALAGKQGEYAATVRELKVRVVPELTDEMAREAHSVESVDELRQIVRGLVEEMARREAEERVRNDLLEQVVANSRVEMPPVIARREAQARLERLESDLLSRGRSLDDYLAQEGTDRERWLREEEMKARWDLERLAVLDEISRREGIEVTREEITSEISKIAQRAGASAQRMRRTLQERGVGRIAERLHQHKVLQFLVDRADITSEGAATSGPAPAPAEPQEEQP